MNKPTIGSLFSGIGGLDLAAQWAGFKTAWMVEKEPFCQTILARHWPGVPIHADIFDTHNLPYVDVVVGGFPCQPFSIAGKQEGDKDERYLLPEMLRVISEVKPSVVLFENVPRFASLDAGYYFKLLLREITTLGYDAEWGHLRASDIGAPHTRNRWFCVAYADSLRRGQGRDHRSERQLLHHVNGNATQSQSEWQGWQRGIGAIGENPAVEHTNGAGQQKHDPATLTGSEALAAWKPAAIVGDSISSRRRGYARRRAAFQPAHRYPYTGRVTQSRLGGIADGLSSRVDFPGFPARPGKNQYPYEPSRVSSDKTPDREARLKAIGNAVVPQVAFPLFVAIYEWLMEAQS